MSKHPYMEIPDRAFWSRGVARLPYADVNPVGKPSFTIERNEKVATAGSCFAQHIARHLHDSGFCYFIAENAHPIFSNEITKDFNFGIFSARYGNIYTSRQLLQLFDRAYGTFLPLEDFWIEPDGSFVDPFRPSCNPGGFYSIDELRADREQHFSSVRRMFEELDIFVFTLGLTECWMSRVDGSTYPICPGTAGGSFDADKYVFVNLEVEEIVSDLDLFIERLLDVNPRARMILTVSPVPLVATAADRHVLSSPTLSKSALRVAADKVARRYSNVTYFESYEIITGNFNRGRYFGDDLRSVTEEGVGHVMKLFLKHYGGVSETEPSLQPEDAGTDEFHARLSEVISVMCDEEALNR